MEAERHGWRNHRAGRETVQGAGGQGGDDVRVADGENTISGKWVVDSGKCDMDAEVTALEGKLSKAREVKAGHDVRVADGKIRLNHD